ncbi:hypothetical protein TNCV_2107981 [Trichonephila clavipes]|nr:hypothetical protein TNCV_2107981 [Trichonephila clavipes]
MYSHVNGNGRSALRMYHTQLRMDECQIKEFFSGHIVNFVKHVRSTTSDMMLADKHLYAVEARKKAS